MHIWGDEWFEKHGENLREAEQWIAEEVFARTGHRLSSKEKYGSLRYEYIHDGEISDWHTLWTVVQEAAIKWPHLKDELYEDIASREDIVGTEICNQYWTSP